MSMGLVIFICVFPLQFNAPLTIAFIITSSIYVVSYIVYSNIVNFEC